MLRDDPGARDGAMSAAARREAQATVKRMFYHGYDSYMKYAFPHDELKPITKSWTDSLGELGNLKKEHLSRHYKVRLCRLTPY